MSESTAPINDTESAEISMERNLKKTQLINFHLTSQRVVFLFYLYIWGEEVEQHCDLHKAQGKARDQEHLTAGTTASSSQTHYRISRKECIYTHEEIQTTIPQCAHLGEECVQRTLKEEISLWN